ncbi:uncharacterized protein LOC125041666 isoform X2 [Penaeus chinensis]|uniref:uncharacterized protein LOC125041666 isoform X2 n=1 Tax=Penaeus chinensis TaxID=139456 RepID=UPI001FB7F180|nr:uncharacterized protein LOC125041666 isoform X2 [Penaeus chinensis]
MTRSIHSTSRMPPSQRREFYTDVAMNRGQSSALARERLPVFKVFVTRLHLDTTDEHVRHCVREATGADPVAVHRIAPREGQNIVSYKVTCHMRHKEALLLPETWPQYSRFREFVEKPPAPVQRTTGEQRVRAQWR